MLPSGDPAFVAYALFGCHRLEGTAPVGNFDAGIQVCGNGQYKLCFNGGGVFAEVWKEPLPFAASGSGTMTVELVYLTSTTGKVVLSAFGQTLECNFAPGKWNSFRNGVKFWKEMTVATSANPITDLWLPANLSRIQTIYMNDFTFGEAKYLRHSGSTTEFSLDAGASVTNTPKLETAIQGGIFRLGIN